MSCRLKTVFEQYHCKSRQASENQTLLGSDIHFLGVLIKWLPFSDDVQISYNSNMLIIVHKRSVGSHSLFAPCLVMATLKTSPSKIMRVAVSMSSFYPTGWCLNFSAERRDWTICSDGGRFLHPQWVLYHKRFHSILMKHICRCSSYLPIKMGTIGWSRRRQRNLLRLRQCRIEVKRSHKCIVVLCWGDQKQLPSSGLKVEHTVTAQVCWSSFNLRSTLR